MMKFMFYFFSTTLNHSSIFEKNTIHYLIRIDEHDSFYLDNFYLAIYYVNKSHLNSLDKRAFPFDRKLLILITCSLSERGFLVHDQ